MSLLIILAGSMILATAGTLRAAVRDYRRAEESGKDGTLTVLVHAVVRSEALRLVKACLAACGVSYALYALIYFELTATGRQVICVLVSVLATIDVLIFINSLADLWSRRHSRHAPKVLRQDK